MRFYSSPWPHISTLKHQLINVFHFFLDSMCIMKSEGFRNGLERYWHKQKCMFYNRTKINNYEKITLYIYTGRKGGSICWHTSSLMQTIICTSVIYESSTCVSCGIMVDISDWRRLFSIHYLAWLDLDQRCI